MRTPLEKLQSAERVLHYHLEDCAYCNTPSKWKAADRQHCQAYYDAAARVTQLRKEVEFPA